MQMVIFCSLTHFSPVKWATGLKWVNFVDIADLKFLYHFFKKI